MSYPCFHMVLSIFFTSVSQWRIWMRWVSIKPHEDIINSSPPGQNGRHFADNVFRCIFVNEKFFIMIKFSLKFVPKGQIDNNTALVEIMAWRRIGNKPLSEPYQCWPDSLTHISSSRGRWVKQRLYVYILGWTAFLRLSTHTHMHIWLYRLNKYLQESIQLCKKYNFLIVFGNSSQMGSDNCQHIKFPELTMGCTRISSSF